MIRGYVIGGLMLISASAIPAAQVGAGRPQAPSPTSPAPAANAQVSGSTLVGCLYREAQIPGRTPNVAERAGVLEDYILADASIPSPARPGATTGATGTAGSSTPSAGNMFKVENIPDEKLKALTGKRVEVVGRIDPEGGTGTGRPANPSGAPTADKGPGPDTINLPELEASSIREIAGTCPATPAPRSR